MRVAPLGRAGAEAPIELKGTRFQVDGDGDLGTRGMGSCGELQVGVEGDHFHAAARGMRTATRFLLARDCAHLVGGRTVKRRPVGDVLDCVVELAELVERKKGALVAAGCLDGGQRLDLRRVVTCGVNV